MIYVFQPCYLLLSVLFMLYVCIYLAAGGDGGCELVEDGALVLLPQVLVLLPPLREPHATGDRALYGTTKPIT